MRLASAQRIPELPAPLPNTAADVFHPIPTAARSHHSLPTSPQLTPAAMPLTFVATPVRAPRSAAAALLPPCSLRGRRLRVAAPRRAQLRHTACAAVKKDPKKDSEAPDEEEKLDEAAMRAAEIHEVLAGLQDFKNRIIDDATKLAKKVRAPKKQLEAALESHPDIIKIDGYIAELEEELKVLGDR